MLYVKWNANVVYWITLCVFVIVFGALGLWVERMVTIVATSFIGAYATIRGLSFLIGGFPDVAKIFALISKQEYEQLKEMTKSWALFYIVGWLVLGIGSMVFQCKKDDGKSVKDDEDGFQKMNEERY